MIKSQPSSKPAPQAAVPIDIAVVGAGIVGLSFALACAHAGESVTILAPGATAKPAPSVPNDALETRVYALSPASKRFLEEICVWDKLDSARIGVAYDMRVFGPRAKWSELHLSAYESGVDALAFIVGHDALISALSAALSFHKKVQFLAESVLGIEVQADAVRIATRSSVVMARLVVGADGIDSMVREAAGISATRKSLDATGIVANFLVESKHRGCAYQWFTSEGVVALLPLPGDAMSLVWSAPDDVAGELGSGSAGDLAGRLAPYVHSSVGQLTPISAVSTFPLQRLKVDDWVKPRVAVIGDAAHVIHPLAGQGLNLGLDDARLLCEILAVRGEPRGVGDLRGLRSFERRRKEAVLTMGTATDALHLLFGGSSGMLASLAGLGMAAVNRVSPLKNQLIGRALRNAAVGS